MSMKAIILLAFSLYLSVILIAGYEVEEEYPDDDFEEFKLYGEPINVLNVTDDNEFIVNVEGIDKIFDPPEIKDRKVVAVSIVGVFRKGKSFLLNYFLRYLYRNFKSINHPNNPLNNTKNWLGHPKDPLYGFSWTSGVERDTNGIIMWSDVFLYDSLNGDKLAIILIDTQGLFDQKTTANVNSKMFALATLISSVQIYNLHNVIQEDQLQYLQFTSDYAKLINNIELDNDDGLQASDIEKPFQNILLLMRDWVNIAEYSYGLKGGKEYLNSILKITKNHKIDAREVRKFIRASYENVNCFLLPHPGDNALNSADFDGEWSELDINFVEQLKNLISWLFDPSNLAPKKIFDDFVTVEEYAEHLKFYFEAASSNALMNVSTIFDSTMESEGNVMMQKSLKIFRQNLRNSEDFENNKFLVELDKIGKSSQKEPMKKFEDLMEKFGANDKFILKWTEKLKNQMLKELKEWKIEVTANFNKFQIIKQKAQEEIDRNKEVIQKDFELKLQELTQKSLQERVKIEQQFKKSLNDFEIEKIKIQEENEKERRRIVQEKMNDLEKARNQCERLISNTKDSYANEMKELKKREEELKIQKTRLENLQKEQEKELKRKLDEEKENYENEIQKLRQKTTNMQNNQKLKIAEAEKRLKDQHERAKLNYMLQIEEYKHLLESQRRSAYERNRNY